MDRAKSSLKHSEEVTCEIGMKLPSLNDYINVCRRNRYEAGKMKKALEDDISIFFRGMPHFGRPVCIHFEWIEDSRRRDLDNVCFAKKFILDALVKSGHLDNDNSKCVVGFVDTFRYGKQAKVVLHIKEVDDGEEETG